MKNQTKIKINKLLLISLLTLLGAIPASFYYFTTKYNIKQFELIESQENAKIWQDKNLNQSRKILELDKIIKEKNKSGKY